MDVAQKAQVNAGFTQVVQPFGHLDVLVNNAAILRSTIFDDCSEDDWVRILAVNLKGTFLCCQAALDQLRSRRGLVINMTSVATKSGGYTGHPPYAASNAGVTSLTLGLACYVAPYRASANGIAPGVIDTDMSHTPKHADLVATIPVGAVGAAVDVEHCALFLASDEARHITGAIIDVNGDLWMD